MQMCLGATYSWSVYVRPLKELTGLLQGPVQLPFSVFYFAFPFTMIFSGFFLKRFGPALCGVSGGILFGSGWILAGWGNNHFAFTITGIGLMGGVGAGLAYIVPIATCIRWFPERKGLVTGIAVAGFGGGAALVSQAAGFMISSAGKTPFEAFTLFGVIFLVLVSIAGSVMKNPSGAKSGNESALSGSGVISEKRFRILYLAMFTGLVAGFAVNANLKQLYSGNNIEEGVAAVSVFAVANALGRVAWGMIFDRAKASIVIQANLIGQALILFCSFYILRSDTGLLVFAFLTGFGYGGVLVLYASTSARLWGSLNVGQIYSLLFSANIPAAISPILAGYGYDYLGSFTFPLILSAILLVSAAFIVGKQRNLLDSESV
ncbi:MAG: transporter, family, oxalate/formate antiporter [Thermodesulfobacteriota bacterium]|nr:transporter, family, oxalate/formate antiporter [Thermodesulfobacteriota bacterium]